MKVSPSILSCDFSKMALEIETIKNADYVHVDVMDGLFVPNLTFGAPVIKSIRKTTNMIFDVHLMIVDPIRYIKDFAEAGSDYITIHVEACEDVMAAINEIKKYGKKVGLSVKPNTPIQDIEEYLQYLDMVLVMSVEPGFGGQSFMEGALSKIERLNKLKEIEGYDYLINVDGGINETTGPMCAKAGADILVAGSYIFGAKDREAIIAEMQKL